MPYGFAAGCLHKKLKHKYTGIHQVLLVSNIAYTCSMWSDSSVNCKVVGTSCIFDFARVTAKSPACKMDFGHSAPNHLVKLLSKWKANIRNNMMFTELGSCEVSVVRTVLSSLRASWTPKTTLQDYNLQDVPTTFQFTLYI